jgi:hypothetical protein
LALANNRGLQRHIDLQRVKIGHSNRYQGRLLRRITMNLVT